MIRLSITNLFLPNATSLNCNITSPGLIHIKGASGCGKTTFLDLLTGLQPVPTDSQISFDIASPDEDPLTISSSNGLLTYFRDINPWISYCSQNSFEGSMSILDVLSMAHDDLDITCPSVNEILLQLGVTHLSQSRATGLNSILVRSLSGGEKKRVFIARTLLRSTPIIILDEPTAGLDSSSSISIWNFLISYCQEKLLFFTSHEELLPFSPTYILKLDN